VARSVTERLAISYALRKEECKSKLALKSEARKSVSSDDRRKMMTENNPFEIPPQVRDLAEKNIDQARQFYNQWMEGISQVMSMWSATPAGGMVPGFDSLRERAIKFAKDNAEAAFALAEELAQAKDMHQLMTLQSSYAQSQVKSYVSQTQELGRLMTEALQGMGASISQDGTRTQDGNPKRT